MTGLPPKLDGVGHYSLALAKEMARNHGVLTRFVVGDLEWGGGNISDFPVYRLSEHTAEAFCSLLAEVCAEVSKTNSSMSCTVILHLSAYGYHKHACPFWLEEGLRWWLGEGEQRRLLTIFHELYAIGPPWKKIFWFSPFQRMIAIRILKMSELVLTVAQKYGDRLHEWDPRKIGKITVFPPFSTIGEPKIIRPLHERTRRLIVFGHKANRSRIYRDSFDALVEACRLLNIYEICDIGTNLGDKFPEINGVNFIATGPLPGAEISVMMCDSVAGFVDYGSGYLAKSSIFAAYCAHGLIPVLDEINDSEADGLFVGNQYIVPRLHSNVLTDYEAKIVADHALTWYKSHSLKSHAVVLANDLLVIPPEKSGKQK